MDLPTYLQIEPVGQCNLRCQMCPIQFRRDGPPYGPPALMAFEMFTSIVDQFPNLRELHLQGLGEPMMHPRFFEMIDYAAGKGIRVTTNTNMTLMSPRRAARCVRSGLACLHVSIDGAAPETYARIRHRGTLARVLRSLDLLAAARAEAGGQGPELRLVAVVMRQNLHELADLVRLAHRYGIASMFVQHLCHDFAEPTLPEVYNPMRQYVDEQTLLSEDLEMIDRHFEEARRTARELGIQLRLPRPRPRAHPAGTPGPDRCDWPWRGAYISYDGRAMPCCMIATPDRMNFGNVGQSSVATVWNGPGYEAFRAKLDSDDPPEVCRSCSVYRGTF